MFLILDFSSGCSLRFDLSTYSDWPLLSTEQMRHPKIFCFFVSTSARLRSSFGANGMVRLVLPHQGDELKKGG
jgi:hypothetical protein